MTVNSGEDSSQSKARGRVLAPPRNFRPLKRYARSCATCQHLVKMGDYQALYCRRDPEEVVFLMDEDPAGAEFAVCDNWTEMTDETLRVEPEYNPLVGGGYEEWAARVRAAGFTREL